MGCGERCGGCPLERSGSGFSQVEIGSRYTATRLLLVGEASGEHEAREGLPFRPYAQAGALLAKTMADANVSRSEVAITNVIRCHPKNDWLEGAPYQFAATQHCISNYLVNSINALQPRAILALGGTAMRALTAVGRGKYVGLDYLRGYVLRGAGAAEGIPVIPAYHPSFIRRGAAHLTSTLRKDIQRAFKVATGQMVEGRHYTFDPPAFVGMGYRMNVSLNEAWAWAEAIDPELPLYWDCETPKTAREDEEDYLSFADRDMKLFQATQRKGEGLAIPFRDEFIEVAKAILASATLKVTQNGWNFDEPVAKANGLEVNVEKGSDDVMVMFGRVEADLPANLQAIAQYCGFPFPWKHLGDSQPEFYGVADVDALAWSYPILKQVMEREGTWKAYVRYFRTYHHRVLRRMSERGDPISEEKRLELKALIEREDQEVDEKVRELVPREVLSTRQKEGYKRTPKDTTGLVEIDVEIRKEEKCQCRKKERESCPVCRGTGVVAVGTVLRRWAEQVEFNPNSSLQVKRLMKHLGHKVPKHSKRTDATTGEASDTTEVKELERLANKTKHPIYGLLIEKRQLSKLMGTYVEGWKPGRDGRVHSTFGHKATWQPSAKSPNLFNGIKRGRTPSQKARVKAFNAMQRAEPGHVMVNLDLKSFHAQTMACEVGNKDYLRLTKIDQHSFTTCHFVKHPERFNLLKWSDADLIAFFKEMKADPVARYKGPMGLMTFKEVRDGKTKSAGLGIGFGMQGRKLYQMYQEDFENEAEAKAISNLIRLELFDGAIGKWQERVKHQAAEEGLLRSKYNGIRRFYDVERWNHQQQRMMGGDQAEAAIAFLPASNAFGYMRDVQLRLDELGYLDRFEMVNSVYDSIQLHLLKEEAEEAIALVAPIMEERSKILVYPIVPDGLSVEAEASVGESMAEMIDAEKYFAARG